MRSRCSAANRPEFAIAYAAALRAGLRLTPLNWHLQLDEATYIVENCEARAFLADARFARRRDRRGGGVAEGVRAALDRRRDPGLRPVRRRASPASRARTSPTRSWAARCSTPRARPAGRRAYTGKRRPAPSGVARLTAQACRLPAGDRPLAVHRAAVSRRSARVQSRGPARRRARRDPDGEVRRRGHAALGRALARDAHAHGRDHVPPPARAARRREGQVRPVVAARDPARRRADAAAREEGDDGLARPDPARVLRRDRGRRHVHLRRRVAAKPGSVGQARRRRARSRSATTPASR